ncbi:MAG: DUF4159 domain-containing protein [Anaerolineae bacterium]
MNREELLKKYPTQRIKPADGMAVTADVWEEAHTFHRRRLEFHSLFSHGPGIVTGLEVIASDPADTSVYILPGIAIDPAGQTIVLPQPVTYDVGRDMQGLLYVLLNYGESRARARRGGDAQAGDPLYVESEFSITATTTLPNSPWVELARVNRSSRDASFTNALNPAAAGLNEIDLRFRREVGAPKEISIGVVYMGSAAEQRRHGLGASNLAQALNRLGNYHVSVEDNVPLGPNIATKTMIYLVGEGNFEIDRGSMNGLRNYVHRGMGTIFIESADPPAETAFMNFLKATGMQPDPLKPGSRLLTHPYLFAAPPAGFEKAENSRIMVGEGVIFDTTNYGLLWLGERRERLPSREEIRAATEWGANLVTYAMERRLASGRQ